MTMLGAHVVANSTASNVALTTGAVTTSASGSTFVVFVAWDTNAAAPTVTDSKLNTYTQVGSSVVGSGAGYSGALFESVNGTGGAVHTFHAAFGGARIITMFAVEVVGGLTSGIRDQAPAGLLDTASPYTSNTTGTTAQANEIALAFCATDTSIVGTETVTWSGGFGALDDQGDTNGVSAHSAFQDTSAVGTFQSSFTASGGGTTDAVSFIVTYKSLSAGGGATPFARRRIVSDDVLQEQSQRRAWLPVSGLTPSPPPPMRSRVALDEPLREALSVRRIAPPFVVPGAPPLVGYDTGDLEPLPADDYRSRGRSLPTSGVAQIAPVLPRARLIVDERSPDEQQRLRSAPPAAPVVASAVPLIARHSPVDEAPPADSIPERESVAPLRATDAPPVTRARQPAQDTPPDPPQRKAWAPPSGVIPSAPPPARPRRTADEQTIDVQYRRPWLPVSGIVPSAPPPARARTTSDETGAPESLQRRPFAPGFARVDSPPIVRPARANSDEQPAELQARRAAPPAPAAPSAPSATRPRAPVDDTQPDQPQRRLALPTGTPPSPPPPMRARTGLDEQTTDTPQRKPWSPVFWRVDPPPPRRAQQPLEEPPPPDPVQRRPWSPIGRLFASLVAKFRVSKPVSKREASKPVAKREVSK